MVPFLKPLYGGCLASRSPHLARSICCSTLASLETHIFSSLRLCHVTPRRPRPRPRARRSRAIPRSRWESAFYIKCRRKREV